MASSTPTASETQMVLQLLTDARSTTYAAVAALTLLVTDLLMTLPTEIRFMWTGKWNTTKMLYLWNRYFGIFAAALIVFFDVQPTHSDKVFIQVQGVMATIIVAVVDSVLLLRVWVLYERSKTVLYLLIPLVMCEIVTMFIISVFSDLPLKEFAHFGPALNGCFSLKVPRFLTAYAVPALVTSSIMFFMTLFKCGLPKFSDRRQMPVITLFARDGLVWFIAVLLNTSANIVIWSAGRPTLAEINIALSLAIYSIISSRVLINIRIILSNDNFMSQTGNTTMELVSLRFRADLSQTAQHAGSHAVRSEVSTLEH